MGIFRKKRSYDYDPYDDRDFDEYGSQRGRSSGGYEDGYYDEYYDEYSDYDGEYYDEDYYDEDYADDYHEGGYDDFVPYDFDDVDYETDYRTKRGGRNGRKRQNGREIRSRRTARSAADYETWRQSRYQRLGYDENFYSDSYISREERRRSRSWFRKLINTLLVLAVLFGGAFTAYKILIKAPSRQVQGGLMSAEDHKGDSENAENETMPASEAPNRESAKVRKGVYTFAIVGKDVEGAHTDTVIVGMFDTVKRKLNFASIPRDTLINTPWEIKKMNYVYPASLNTGKDAAGNLLEAVSQLLGYPVGSYAILDIKAAGQLVDVIGGVYFDVPCDMDWDAPDQKIPLHIHIKKGYQLLNGEQAVNVLRFRYSNDGRHTYARGDIDRINVQQDLMKAILSQTLSVKNIPNLGRALEIFENNVETNLKGSNIAFFAQEFLKLRMEDIKFMVLPGKPDGVLYDINYVIPDIDAWLKMVNEYLNPFDTPIRRENVDMLSFDGVDFVTTQGKIKGGRYSFRGSQE